MSSASKTFLNILNRITEWLCVGLLSALVLVSGLQVFFRYALHLPLVWSEEAARYLLVWLSFATAGLVVRENGNPRIEIISTYVSPRTSALIAFITQIMVAAFLFVFVWVSWSLTAHYVPYSSLATGISQALPRMALPIGGLLMLINMFPAMSANWTQLRRAESYS